MKTEQSYRCVAEGCPEWGRYTYDTRKQARDHARRLEQSGGYKCVRHTHPDEMLSLTNLERRTEYTAQGGQWAGYISGFTHGPGFRAYASDFPDGTKLEITVKVTLPAETRKES